MSQFLVLKVVGQDVFRKIFSLHERSSARQTGEKNCLKLYTSFNVTFRHVS